MAMRVSGVTIAALRSVRTRADIDYFDRREARAFLGYKLITVGIPAAAFLFGVWKAFA